MVLFVSPPQNDPVAREGKCKAWLGSSCTRLFLICSGQGHGNFLNRGLCFHLALKWLKRKRAKECVSIGEAAWVCLTFKMMSPNMEAQVTIISLNLGHGRKGWSREKRVISASQVHRLIYGKGVGHHGKLFCSLQIQAARRQVRDGLSGELLTF